MCDLEPRQLALQARLDCARMIFSAKSSHIGVSFSCIDILSVIYAMFVDVEKIKHRSTDRARIVMSKGHASSALYAILANAGIINRDVLSDYCNDGASLGGHVTKKALPGIEFSTGSLGHGFPLAVGSALFLEANSIPTSHFVIIGDGECDEGSIWETASFASTHNIKSVIPIIDNNKLQGLGNRSPISKAGTLASKWQAFGWQTFECDGHSVKSIANAISEAQNSKRPSAIIAKTIKGKGVSFMEDDNLWHYRSPSDEEYKLIIEELDAKYPY